MPYNLTPLNSTKLDALRGPSFTSAQYVSVCPNVTVFSALVTGVTDVASFASVRYDNVTVGTYTDIEEGQTIIIGTDLRNATFVGRIRRNGAGVIATSDTLYINETSAPVTDSMQIWVLDDYRIWSRKPRRVSGVMYMDYDVPFNVTGDMKPLIRNLQSCYAGYVNPVTGTMSVTLNAQVTVTEHQATTGTWLWNVRDGTIVSGTSSSANITVTFPAGFRWIRVQHTDTFGNVGVMRIAVWAHSDGYPPALNCAGLQTSVTLDDGWSGSVTAFDGIETLLDNTLLCVWSEDYYNGARVTLERNVNGVFRLRNESNVTQSDADYSALKTVTYTLEGIGQQLSRQNIVSLQLQDVAIASRWTEIAQLTPYRIITFIVTQLSTLSNVTSIEFDAFNNDYRTRRRNVESGSTLSAINDIADTINARMEFSAWGASFVGRSVDYIPALQRNDIIYANFVSPDWIDLDLSVSHVEKVGQVTASGATAVGDTDGETELVVVQSLSPGETHGGGAASVSMNNQILLANVTLQEAQAELNQRAGDRYARENNVTQLRVTLPAGYYFLQPSKRVRYTFTIASNDTVTGRSYNINNYWHCVALSVTHDNEAGSKQVEASFELETQGRAGRALRVSNPGVTAPALPYIPSQPNFPVPIAPELIFGPNPPSENVPPNWYNPPPLPNPTAPAPTDGSTVALATARQLWLSTNFKLASPTYREVTPQVAEQLTIRAGLWDYLHSNSAFRLLALDAGGYNTVTDFETTDGGFVAGGGGVGAVGVWTSGVGWEDTLASATGYRGIQIYRTFAPTIITDVSFVYSMVRGTKIEGTPWGVRLYRSGVTVFDGVEAAGQAPNATLGTIASNNINAGLGVECDAMALVLIAGNIATGNPGGSCTIHSLTTTGLGSGGGSGAWRVFSTENIFQNPPTWTAGAALTLAAPRLMRGTDTARELVVYDPTASELQISTDGGVTWGSVVTVGDPVGVNGGGDVIVVGDANIFAADGTARIAATIGGAFSDEPNGATVGTYPSLIHIPLIKFLTTSTRNTNTTQPDYVLGANASVGGEALWRVTASGKTNITPTTNTVCHSPNAIATSKFDGLTLVVGVTVGGTKRLYSSAAAGNQWFNRGNIAADYIRIQRGDASGRNTYIATSDGRAFFTNQISGTINNSHMRRYPSLSTLQFIEPYG